MSGRSGDVDGKLAGRVVIISAISWHRHVQMKRSEAGYGDDCD